MNNMKIKLIIIWKAYNEEDNNNENKVINMYINEYNMKKWKYIMKAKRKKEKKSQ